MLVPSMRVRTLSLTHLELNHVHHPKAKGDAVARRGLEANLIGIAEQETYRESPAPIYVAFAVGALVVTVAWITLLLYGAWRFIAWIAA